MNPAANKKEARSSRLKYGSASAGFGFISSGFQSEAVGRSKITFPSSRAG
jgi:hypothetical protein